MLYFDSSLIVTLMSNEARTGELQNWFSERDPDDLCMSEWALTEFQSAMSFKRRTAQISAVQREQAEQVFQGYVDAHFKVLQVSSSHFRRAAAIAGREDINIRAGDALHLAVAVAHGATICTLDNKMRLAAAALAVDCLIP